MLNTDGTSIGLRWGVGESRYKYETRFAIPVFADTWEVEQYKIFRAAMIIRHGADNKKYIYDIINIKKETGDLFKSEDPTQ